MEYHLESIVIRANHSIIRWLITCAQCMGLNNQEQPCITLTVIPSVTGLVEHYMTCWRHCQSPRNPVGQHIWFPLVFAYNAMPNVLQDYSYISWCLATRHKCPVIIGWACTVMILENLYPRELVTGTSQIDASHNLAQNWENRKSMKQSD